MKEKRFWNEKMEAMPKEQLLELRMNKLKKQLKYVYGNSEFYQKKFKDAGIVPEDIKTWDDFRKMPVFFTKEDEKISQEMSMERFGHAFGMHLCAPLEDVIGISATSGTTGIPTLSYLNTKHDLEINNEGWARVLWRIGVRPGDVVLHAFGLSMWIIGVPGVYAMINMGVRCVPVGAEGGTERILHMANLTRPSTIVATPSLVEHLIERAPKVIGKEVKELGIKRILCAGEPGAGLPEFRKKMREAYGGAEVYDMMGPAWGIAIVSCEEADKISSYEDYQGMHECTPDYVIWSDDLLDPVTFKPVEVKEGATGVALITSIDQEARPVIRFNLGDIFQVHSSPCKCGCPGNRLKVLSRIDDMLIVKGINVYPSAIKNIIESFAPRTTGHLRIVLTTKPPKVTPPVYIKVEYGPEVQAGSLGNLKQEIENKIKDVLRFRADIELIPPETLERVPGKTKLIEKKYE